jgi:hypothetical protein
VDRTVASAHAACTVKRTSSPEDDAFNAELRLDRVIRGVLVAIPALSTHAKHARTQGTGGPRVDTVGRQSPSVRGLLLVAVVVVGGVLLEPAESVAGQTGWLVGLVALATAIAVGRRAAEVAQHGGPRIEQMTAGPVALALDNARLEAELRTMADTLRRSGAQVATAVAEERHRSSASCMTGPRTGS